MKGKETSPRKWWLLPVGTGAAILVVAGIVGLPFDVVAAIVLGAALVLIVDPER